MGGRVMDYYSKKILLWSILASLGTIVIMAGLSAFTEGPLARRVACFPNYPTCTKGVNSWDRMNETCRCEKLPEVP